MADREKVLKALECLANNPFLDCDKCPYNAPTLIPLKQRCDYTRICADALALLEEQEPKMVVQTTSTIRCPGCGKQITSKGALHKEIKYCWKCGQAVKWE